MDATFQSVIKIFQKNNGVLKSSQLFKPGTQPRILYAMRDNGLVVQDGLRRKKATFNEIQRFARVDRVEKIIRPYLEALT